MSTDLHTLTGVITDPLMKLDRLTSYYFVTTNANLITVKRSFTEDLADEENAASRIATSLEHIYKGHFDRVTVEVVGSLDVDNLQTLRLAVAVVDKGRTYQLRGIPSLEGAKNNIVRMHFEEGGLK